MSNKFMNYSDGEGLTFGDLLHMQYLRHVAWEERLYHRLVRILNGGSEPSLTNLLTDHSSGISDANLFCLDRGFTPYNLSGYVIGALGGSVLRSTAIQYPGGGSYDYDRFIHRVFYSTLASVATLTVNTDSNPRYDLLSWDSTEAAGGAETRDFEDSVTRAKSSSSANKRLSTTMSITVTQGTPAATPAIPAVPSGDSRWCAVLLPGSSGAISHDDDGSGRPGFIDFTYPCATGLREVWMPGRLAFAQTNWGISDVGYAAGSGANYFALTNSTANTEYAIFHPPHELMGNAAARLLGLTIATEGGGTVDLDLDLMRLEMAGGETAALIRNITTLNLVGGDNIFNVDLTGSATDPLDAPIWGNGYAAGRTYEGTEGFSDGDKHHTVGIRLQRTSATAQAVTIQGIMWRYAI